MLEAGINIPHVVHFRGVDGDVIKMDRVPAGNIDAEYLQSNAPRGKMAFQAIINIGKQLLEFSRAGKGKIIHCDLKPANLIWEEECNHLTILDLGGSQIPGQVDPSITIHTRAYISPEILLGQPPSCSSDLWSIGCILFELMTGRRLFKMTKKWTPNLHLHRIWAQLGPPLEPFLRTCPKASDYFNLEEKIEFLTSLPCNMVYWKLQIEAEAKVRGVSDHETKEFIKLLEGMLKYEDRAAPEELLKSPLFQEDISFHLKGNFSRDDVVKIYSEMERTMFEQKLIDQFPEPLLTLKMSQRVTRTCLHIPKEDKYRIEVVRGNSLFSRTYSLTEGQELALYFQEDDSNNSSSFSNSSINSGLESSDDSSLEGDAT
jgi:serine/threonine protein kinase